MVSNKVAVIIPVHENRVSVEKTIISLHLQDFEDWVGLICHFNVTPAVDKIIRCWAKKDQRFQLLEVGLAGLVPPLKKAESIIRNGNFKYVAKIDSDDIMLPGKLSTQIEFLNRNQGISGCGGQRLIVDQNFKLNLNLQPPYPRSSRVIKRWFLMENPIVHSTFMIRADEFLQCGGYELAMKYGEDADIYLKVMRQSNFQNLKEILVAYQVDTTRVRKIEDAGLWFRILQLRVLMFYLQLNVDYECLGRSKNDWIRHVERRVGPLIQGNNWMIFMASKAFSAEAKEMFGIKLRGFVKIFPSLIRLLMRLRVVLFIPRSIMIYLIWIPRWRTLMKSINRYEMLDAEL